MTFALPIQQPASAHHFHIDSRPYEAKLPNGREVQEISFTKRCIGLLASKSMFSAKSTEELDERRKHLLDSYRGARVINIYTPEKFCLDGVHVFPLGSESEFNSRAILFVPGADGFYEDNWSFRFIDWVRRNIGDIHIVLVNYPGVNRSQGIVHPQTLAHSVYSAFTYLTEHCNVLPCNVAIFSQSLGGMATSLALPMISERYPNTPIQVISERSMDTFLPVVRQVCGDGIIASIACSILSLGGWNIEHISQNIAQTPGDKLIIYSEADPIVQYEHSIYNALCQRTTVTRASIWAMKMRQQEAGDVNPHWRPFKEDELTEMAYHVRRMLRLPLHRYSCTLSTSLFIPTGLPSVDTCIYCERVSEQQEAVVSNENQPLLK